MDEYSVIDKMTYHVHAQLSTINIVIKNLQAAKHLRMLVEHRKPEKRVEAPRPIAGSLVLGAKKVSALAVNLSP
jgi:hypothetical protein